ncbi:hypothetical protein H2199_005489 [Coniosporium tulheliwenetii]|nr:hypothetical protein H2199_005489 [Cladosporium sp. JES 115]
MNKALHSVAAHVHRYLSELESLESTVDDIKQRHNEINEKFGLHEDSDSERIVRALDQVLSQVKAMNTHAKELEKKTGNILALLFNRIQISNDRQLVANGVAMQEIMKATQDEAKVSRRMADQSQRLAEEMKKDSVAMKAIAIVTMAFLPGASFAALLSMPFFDDDKWLGEARRVWVWAILTIIFTALAFWFYLRSRRHDAKKRAESKSDPEKHASDSSQTTTDDVSPAATPP